MLTKTNWRFVALLLLCLQIYLPLFAQTSEQANLEKYWNYRDRFRKWFIKLGSGPGEGIQFKYKDPKGGGGGGPNNPFVTQYTPTGFNPGDLHMGDAPANMGDYLAVLSTEYKLLKDAGQNYTSTLNELYYVLQAINRLDRKAEFYFSSGLQAENLNGFFMRADAPLDFCDNWGKNGFNPYNSIVGSIVTNGTNERRDYVTHTVCDNIDEADPTTPHLDNNEESNDQLVGLLYGLAFVKKFVAGYETAPVNAAFNFHVEISAITDRIITYVRSKKVYRSTNPYLDIALTLAGGGIQPCQFIVGGVNNNTHMNWIITNPTSGDMVDNKGGLSQGFAYPMCAVAKYITGTDYWENVRVETSSSLLPCYFCDIAAEADKNDMEGLWNGLPSAWLGYPLDFTGFDMIGLELEACNIPIGLPPWTLMTNDLILPIPPIADMGAGTFSVDYNANMMLQLASVGRGVSGYTNWSSQYVGQIAGQQDMEIFDLTRYLFDNGVGATFHPQSFFQTILSSAPCIGPNQMDAGSWRATSRWAHPGSLGPPGEYNGNDYMILYNLYRLAFGNSTSLPDYKNKPCQCYSSAIFRNDAQVNDNDSPPANTIIDPTLNDITSLATVKTVIPRFSHDYNPMGIRLPEFLVHDMSVTGSGQINVQTDLVLCKDAFLTIYSANGLVLGEPTGNIDYSSTLTVRDGTILAVGINGSMTVNTGSQIIVEDGGTLVFYRYGNVTIEDNAKIIVKPGGHFICHPNVQVDLRGANALFDVQGTTDALSLASGEYLTFTKAGAATGGLAQFANGLITMQTGSTFTNDGCRLKMFDVDYRHDATFVLQNNSVTDFKFSNDITLNTGETMPVLQNSAATGGTLLLNSNNDVSHYRNFVLNSNATINSTGCKIRLTKYHFDYFQNAIINLAGDEAGLVFGGTINLNTNADLHFNGSGYFGFSLEQDWTDYQNITATPTSTITMIGNGKEDLVMNVEQNTWVHGNDDMGKFKINDGKIIFDAGSQITLANPYELYQVSCKGSGNGFLLGGVDDHKIDRVDFTELEYGIRAVLAWGPIMHSGNALNITNSTFKNIGIQAIDVLGKGLNLTNCLFDENFTWNINARDMEFKSIFRDVTIRLSYDEMVNFTTPSSGSLYIIDSHFNSGYGVVFNGPNELTFQCSEVNAFQGRNLTLGLDAQLVASPQLKPRAGHTNFHSFRGAIFNDAKTITIDQGHNDFSIEDLRPFDPIDPQFIMYGVLKGFQSSQLSAINNTWYAGSTNPLLNTDYKLWRSGGAVGPPKNLDMIGNLPEAIGDCPFEPQPPINNDAGRVHPLVYCDKCPEVQVANLYLPLNNAVKMAIDTLSDDTLRYDLIGINLLRDILMQSMEYDIDNTNELTELAYVRLKQALGNAYRFGLLRANEGSNDYVEKVLQVVNRKTERARWADNDNDEYYSMLDQAAVYRLINDRVRATEILNSLPSCLEMTEEQHYFLEALIRNYQAEEMVISGAMPIEEFWEYAQGDQRTFQKFANTQANIDTIWVDSIPFATVPAALTTAMDGDGNTYNVVSAADSSLNYKITKTDAGNTTVWEQYFDGWQNSTDSVKAITMDANSYIYVTGKSWNGYDYDIATVKYDTAGNQYWTAIYNDLETGNDEPYSIAVDSAFHVLIYAHSFNDTVNLYKQIFYTQCDSTCIPQRKADDGKKEVPQEFSIQPNPATTTITIVINDEQANDSYKINLYDMKGKKVLSKFITSNFTLDVSKLAKGAYHVQLSNLTTKKILKGRNVVIN